ncbi:MAG: hypothetical protein M1839_006759 [Geoglossum umbratile]|nr:MAG: hypothetical protein M1839_006759 [Geoglossum umbratile]
MTPLSTLTVKEKSVIQGKPIDRVLDPWRKDFEDNFIPPNTLASYTLFTDIINSALRDKAVQELIESILVCLLSLPASGALPSHNTPSQNLHLDILAIVTTFINIRQLNKQAAATFLTILMDRGDDQLIWSAIYDLVNDPKAPPTGNHSCPDPFLLDLHRDWHQAYLRDSLDALQLQMVECLEDKSDYYSKTMVFIQSSGMGKSRLADTFGKFCLMINFILHEQGDGYPLPDSEILRFICQPPTEEAYIAIFDSQTKSDHVKHDKFAGNKVAMV